MELFHIHIEGTKDNMYVPGKEIVVNDSFNNRLYNITYKYSYIVNRKDFPYLFSIIDNVHKYNHINPVGETATLSEILECYNVIDRSTVPIEEIQKLTRESFTIVRRADITKREMALEEYRKNNASDKPSRLHSIYACKEEGLDYWYDITGNNKFQIFRIESLEDPFQTNEQLLPDERLCYEDLVAASMRYFNPRSKDINKASDEFLVKGKVKILERVC